MSENQTVNIAAHPSIYNGSTGRELRIDFSLPSSGTNEQTGILLLVPGFGGNIDSKVYKKMREQFADKFNLVTVQCAFFGDQFMQGAENFTLDNIDAYIQEYLTREEKEIVSKDTNQLMRFLSKQQITLPVKAKIDETEDIFNDMGIMQAIDLITSLEAVKILLEGNGLAYNSDKIMGYGHSHGAYLLHLVNRLSPNLLTNIIDNSGWIEPAYLTSNRYLFQNIGEMTLQLEFDYLAKRILSSDYSFNLSDLYDGFDNQAKIVVFQGTNDNLIDHYQKEQIVKTIPHARLVLVSEEQVDGEVFKSNTHGLNADFLNMFQLAYKEFSTEEVKRKYTDNTLVKIGNREIKVNYSQGLPIFSVSFK
ncbi:DUF2920 family protein [Sporosarcina sp. PTS2304]|uniref:DUF2920 family protein n=1 Tax=Sporosarcina sp. PTS2304 TaxID=2283194 RepID=UPI000E0D8806|nr:DUF2920 family protein [Sporosarcina sp. PTS2304]AXH98464.1 DUF2920 family protein [Sporosarcina sp. PTS2304]